MKRSTAVTHSNYWSEQVNKHTDFSNYLKKVKKCFTFSEMLWCHKKQTKRKLIIPFKLKILFICIWKVLK